MPAKKYVCKGREKEYMREYGREWRKRNAGKCAEYSRASYRRNPQRHKESHRRWVLRNRYGITAEYYQEIIAAQGGVCLICAKPPGKKGFHVDHNHATGEVRGLLCSTCNSMIGMARENPDILKAAMNYLRIFNAP